MFSVLLAVRGEWGGEEGDLTNLIRIETVNTASG